MSQLLNTDELQENVGIWMLQIFGEEIANDRDERNQRFLEEALEFVQANGYNRKAAHAMVDYVFDRPVGELHQETGGTIITLVAACNQAGINIGEATNEELRRCWASMDKIRAKQKLKPSMVFEEQPTEVAEWNPTNVQMAIVMALHGTPDRKEQARAFFKRHLLL